MELKFLRILSFVKKNKKGLEKMKTNKTKTIKAFVKLKVLQGIRHKLARHDYYNTASVPGSASLRLALSPKPKPRLKFPKVPQSP